MSAVTADVLILPSVIFKSAIFSVVIFKSAIFSVVTALPCILSAPTELSDGVLVSDSLRSVVTTKLAVSAIP